MDTEFAVAHALALLLSRAIVRTHTHGTRTEAVSLTHLELISASPALLDFVLRCAAMSRLSGLAPSPALPSLPALPSSLAGSTGTSGISSGSTSPRACPPPPPLSFPSAPLPNFRLGPLLPTVTITTTGPSGFGPIASSGRLLPALSRKNSMTRAEGALAGGAAGTAGGTNGSGGVGGNTPRNENHSGDQRPKGEKGQGDVCGQEMGRWRGRGEEQTGPEINHSTEDRSLIDCGPYSHLDATPPPPVPDHAVVQSQRTPT